MAIQTSGSISLSDVREEGGKISWRSPNYPTIPDSMRLNISYGWAQNRDVNHQLGRDPNDGSFDWGKYFGWDTWRRPIFSDGQVMQFTESSGLRVLWEVNGGDKIRSAYAIYVSTTKPTQYSDLASGDLEAIVRYGPEWNPSANVYEQYCYFYNIGDQARDYRLVVLGEDGNDVMIPFLDSGWGRHSNSDDIDNAHLVAPSSVVENTPLRFSAYLQGISAGTYYVAIVPMDGREFHELSDVRTDDSYDTSNNPLTPSSYNKGPIHLPQVTSLGDVGNGNGGIEVFSGYGTWSANNVGDTSAVLSPTNKYFFFEQFLDDSGEFFWVYYSSSSVQPSYNESGEDEFSQGEDKWFYATGFPIDLNGLSENTTYYFWVEPVDPADTNTGPTSYGANADGNFQTTTSADEVYDENIPTIDFASGSTNTIGTTVTANWTDEVGDAAINQLRGFAYNDTENDTGLTGVTNSDEQGTVDIPVGDAESASVRLERQEGGTTYYGASYTIDFSSGGKGSLP